MKGILNTETSSASAPLTLDALLRTYAAAARPGPPHHHLIAASARPGSIVACGDCGTPVRVPDNWGA